MRARLSGAVSIVYDNYNALAIGFGSGEEIADVIFSVALYPRWISLFFFDIIEMPDPEKLLRGEGKTCRHIVLKSPEMLDTPAVENLIAYALARLTHEIDPTRAQSSDHQIDLCKTAPPQAVADASSGRCGGQFRLIRLCIKRFFPGGQLWRRHNSD